MNATLKYFKSTSIKHNEIELECLKKTKAKEIMCKWCKYLSNSIGIGKKKMSNLIGFGKAKMSLSIVIGKKNQKPYNILMLS